MTLAAENGEAPDPELIERADRLKEAVKRAGGGAAVARQIGMPVPTLNNYLAGRDMKVSALVSLAKACSVSVEWLATGKDDAEGQGALDVPVPQPGGGQLLGEISNALDAPINFLLIVLALRACKEFFERQGLPKPTLRVALGWIGGPYSIHSTIEDRDFTIVQPAALP